MEEACGPPPLALRTLRSVRQGEGVEAAMDAQTRDLGESDRMTLLFRKRRPRLIFFLLP